MLTCVVGLDTRNRANSLAEILGVTGMEDFLATKEVGNGRCIHIGPLSRQTVLACEAEHLGFDGFFVFEAFDRHDIKGINILGKVASFDAGMQLAELIHTMVRQPDSTHLIDPACHATV